jgi:hypothetical protein
MAPERRKQLLLGALAVVLIVVTYRLWTDTSAAPSPSSNQGRAAARAAQSAPAVEAPDVHLQVLEADRPKPAASERNLFRFKPKVVPPPPVVAPPPMAAPAGPPPPTGPPPLPPIQLKFIGTLTKPAGERIAILTDTTGHIDYGGEGSIIGGRYRVVKIGVESIELTYLDGRGRQTIRLTGS